MDIAICIFNKESNLLQYAGAYNSLYLINGHDFCEIKADRMPIGISEKKVQFRNNQMQVQKGDVFYLFSDGYIDQFHHETNEKFKSKRFQEMLRDNHSKSMNEQKKIVSDRIIDWIGNGEQIDDIMVLGIRI